MIFIKKKIHESKIHESKIHESKMKFFILILKN